MCACDVASQGRIVLARIVMERMSASQLVLAPVYIVVLNDAFGAPLFNAHAGAFALLAIAIAAYVHFAMVSVLPPLVSVCKL
jgi:hypothetical protein